jgi:hypothetical protein
MAPNQKEKGNGKRQNELRSRRQQDDGAAQRREGFVDVVANFPANAQASEESAAQLE